MRLTVLILPTLVGCSELMGDWSGTTSCESNPGGTLTLELDSSARETGEDGETSYPVTEGTASWEVGEATLTFDLTITREALAGKQDLAILATNCDVEYQGSNVAGAECDFLSSGEWDGKDQLSGDLQMPVDPSDPSSGLMDYCRFEADRDG